FADSATGLSRVMAKGDIGLGKGFHTHHLTVTVAPLQLALAAAATHALPVGGTIAGSTTVSGSTDEGLHASADLVHHDGAALTHVVAAGDVSFALAAPAPDDRPIAVPLAPAAHTSSGPSRA